MNTSFNNTYNDILIGFLVEDNIPNTTKECNNTALLNKVYQIIHEYCIIQYSEKYNDDNAYNKCVICNTHFNNKIYVYYDGFDRYIFPGYYWHTIKEHHIPLDDKVLTLIKNIFDSK